MQRAGNKNVFLLTLLNQSENWVCQGGEQNNQNDILNAARTGGLRKVFNKARRK